MGLTVAPQLPKLHVGTTCRRVWLWIWLMDLVLLLKAWYSMLWALPHEIVVGTLHEGLSSLSVGFAQWQQIP